MMNNLKQFNLLSHGISGLHDKIDDFRDDVNNQFDNRFDRVVKREIHKLPDNNIPEETHIKAGRLAKAFMKLPPKTEKELKEQLKSSN